MTKADINKVIDESSIVRLGPDLIINLANQNRTVKLIKGDEDILLTPDTLRKMFDFLKSNEENY